MQQISEDINPWTSRLKQTFLEGATLPKNINYNINNHNNPLIKLNTQFQRNNIASIPKSHDDVLGSKISHLKVPQTSQQLTAYQNADKTPISLKIISFELKCKADQQKKKQKHLPFNLNNLRQNTEQIHISQIDNSEQKVDLSQSKKVLMIKRYFTQQKRYSEGSPKVHLNRSQLKQTNIKQKQLSELSQIHRSEQVRKKRVIGIKFVKLARTKRQVLSPEDIVKQEQLYESIRNLCDCHKKNTPSHLSLMKRNHNLKKLQKLLKNEESMAMRVNLQ